MYEMTLFYPQDLVPQVKRPYGFWESKANQRAFLVQVGRRLGIAPGDYASWYKISNKDLLRHGGRGLLGRYNGSLSKLLASVFSEHPWDIGQFVHKPRNYWSSTSNKREYLTELGKVLGVKENDLNGWYNVTHASIIKRGGRGLFSNEQTSLYAVLQSVFPEHPWDPSKFANKPRNYWASASNQKAFLLNLAKKLGMKEGDYSGFYGLTGDQILKEGGRGLLEHHNNSVSELLVNTFPEHSWDYSKFLKKPKNYWSPSNQRALLLDIASKLGIKEGDFESWYNVNTEDIITNGGAYLLVMHRSSISLLLKSVFPEHQWDSSKFVARSRNFWASPENQKNFMLDLGSELGIKESDYERWKDLGLEDIRTRGGAGLVAHFKGSLPALLESVFPEHNWRAPSTPS